MGGAGVDAPRPSSDTVGMTRMTMASVAFDTLSYARRLKAAGVDEAQAEAHAEAVRDAITEGVATKDDLDRGLASLRTDMAELRAEFKADVANLETRLTVRFVGIAVGIVLANAGATVAAVMALVNLLP